MDIESFDVDDQGRLRSGRLDIVAMTLDTEVS